MADTIPLQYVQSLLRLAPMGQEELRAQLTALNLPLVLLQPKAVADARIPVEDYGRLFIHIVRKLQESLPSNSADVESTLLYSAYRMMFQAMLHANTLEQAMQRASVYFQRLQAHGETFHLEEDGELVRCRFDFSDDNEVDQETEKMRSTDYGGHADEVETSMVYAIRPDLVHPEHALTQSGKDQARLNLPYAYTGIWWYASYPNHYAGDGSTPKKEIGEMNLESRANQLATLIKSLKTDDSIEKLQNLFYDEADNPINTKQ